MRKHCPGGKHHTFAPLQSEPRGIPWEGGSGHGLTVAGEPGCHFPSILRPVAITVQFWRKPPSQAHVLSSPGAGTGCGAGGDPRGQRARLAAPTRQPLRLPGTGRCPSPPPGWDRRWAEPPWWDKAAELRLLSCRACKAKGTAGAFCTTVVNMEG